MGFNSFKSHLRTRNGDISQWHLTSFYRDKDDSLVRDRVKRDVEIFRKQMNRAEI